MTANVWTVPDPAVVDGPLTGADRPLLEGMLAWQRSTLLSVCAGLTAEQLASRPLASTELSLLGLVRHLAKVERIWLRQRVAGETIAPLHGGAGDTSDFDAGGAGGAADDVAALRDEWRRADAAIAGLASDLEIQVHGQAMSLRMVLIHLIYEYSRHNGHADLLREAIDGVTGR